MTRIFHTKFTRAGGKLITAVSVSNCDWAGMVVIQPGITNLRPLCINKLRAATHDTSV
ncbi:MAG: hypothetical protein K9M81_01045 [Chthoniobacterales bacterium]|nr:hypothetical protein [Chthoniobacterales bacterium]